MMDGWNMTGWAWGWMTLTMVIGTILVAIIVVVVLRSTTADQEHLHAEDAIDILDRRLASGEIDDAEYRQRRAALMSPRK